jgi:hypothetical protein
MAGEAEEQLTPRMPLLAWQLYVAVPFGLLPWSLKRQTATYVRDPV